MDYDQHASVVLVVDESGNMVSVAETTWEVHIEKLPGGKSLPGETPKETAVRELEEETGIVVSEEDLIPVNQEDRGHHGFYTFLVYLKGSLKDMKRHGTLKKKGDEGEIVSIFSLLDVYMMATGRSSQRFLESHYLEDRGGIEKKLEELLMDTSRVA